jgi:hypothetical protein
MVLLLHVASLKKKDIGASTQDLDGSRRNASLMNQEKFWSLKVRDDVTCFSHGCCNVVGGLVKTALRPWSFMWKILVGRVSPDARVTLSRKIPGRFRIRCSLVQIFLDVVRLATHRKTF